MAKFVSPLTRRVTDLNDDPVPGGTCEVYVAGLTTPAILYSDVAMTTPLPWPLVADGNGILPQAYAKIAKYDIIHKGADGVEILRSENHEVFAYDEVTDITIDLVDLQSRVATLEASLATAEAAITALEAWQALFTSGSNDDGNWARVPFATPLLIQWGRVDSETAGTIVADMPTPFASVPRVLGTCEHASALGRTVHTRETTATACSFERRANSDDAASAVPVDFIAIGEAP